jgi:hypothetical protein
MAVEKMWGIGFCAEKATNETNRVDEKVEAKHLAAVQIFPTEICRLAVATHELVVGVDTLQVGHHT